MGHHVYFDNYYNSPDLIDLLHKRKMYACGTVRKNQRSVPLAVSQAKLKQGETVFHDKDNQAKKRVGESTQAHACFVCNVSKEALSDAGFEDSYKPKKYTSYWCPIYKHALCIDPCFKLYHTEKDYTSEIIKIARMSVKPIQKDAQHV